MLGREGVLMTYQRIAALVALIFTLSGCGSATLDTLASSLRQAGVGTSEALI